MATKLKCQFFHFRGSLHVFTGIDERKMQCSCMHYEYRIHRKSQLCSFFSLLCTFIFFFSFLLKDNYLTECCCFLSNLNRNQPQVNTYPLTFDIPSISIPIPPLQVETEPLFEFPEPYSKFPFAIYFTYGNVSFHVTLSKHLNLSTHLPMSISLSLCLFLHYCPVNKFFSSIFLDSVYMCQNTIFIFLFLNYFTLYNRFQVHPLHQN